jgi:hypothetical protein
VITGERVEKTRVEYHFDFPLDARELADAIHTVEAEDVHREAYNDDRYFVKSDGETLIFYWEAD